MCIYKSTVAPQNSSKAWGTGAAILQKKGSFILFLDHHTISWLASIFEGILTSSIAVCCWKCWWKKACMVSFCALEHMSFHCANELFQNSDWHIVKGRLSTLSSAVFWVVCELLYMQADGAEIIRIVTFIAASCAEWEFLLLNTISQCKFSQPAGTYLSA